MASTDTAQSSGRTRRTAWLLAIATLVPFVAIAVAMVLSGRDSGWFLFLIDVFKTWSVATLTFLGGIRWGLALREEKGSAQLLIGVVPVIIGWPALFAPDAVGIAILLVAHCGQGAWDSLAAGRGQVPRWFGELRIAQTLVIAAAHIALFVSIY